MKKIFGILFLITTLLFTYTMTVFSYSRWYDYDYDYPVVYDVYWSGRTARWSVSGMATEFEVRLYRDGSRVTTRTLTSRSINFDGYLDRSGYNYYFEVRPYNRYTGWGDWVTSDSIYINYRDNYRNDYKYYNGRYYWDDYYRRNNYIRPDISYSRNQGPPINSDVSGRYNSYGSSYGNYYGSYPMNTWVQQNGYWYYYDGAGRLVTGFCTIDGVNYYFYPDGIMATGNVTVNGVAHYFDSSGAMIY